MFSFRTPTKNKNNSQIIDTYVRIRPPGGLETIRIADKNKTKVKLNFNNRHEIFKFTQVFEPRDANEELYKTILASGVPEFFLGSNILLFAFGSTGSGKTYTVLGDPRKKVKGLINYLLHDLFKHFPREVHDQNLSLRIKFFEIYGEQIFDLTEGKKYGKRNEELPRTRYHLSFDMTRITDENRNPLSSVNVKTLQESLRILEFGAKNRRTNKTRSNPRSSRSHAIYQIELLRGDSSQPVSQISVVDLAGSERVKMADTAGNQLKESVGINSSLFALSRCISAMNAQSKTIPYRQSTLTKVFRKFFEHVGTTEKNTIKMIVNISTEKAKVKETKTSLDFGSLASQVTGRFSKVDSRRKKRKFRVPPLPPGAGGWYDGAKYIHEDEVEKLLGFARIEGHSSAFVDSNEMIDKIDSFHEFEKKKLELRLIQKFRRREKYLFESGKEELDRRIIVENELEGEILRRKELEIEMKKKYEDQREKFVDLSDIYENLKNRESELVEKIEKMKDRKNEEELKMNIELEKLRIQFEEYKMKQEEEKKRTKDLFEDSGREMKNMMKKFNFFNFDEEKERNEPNQEAPLPPPPPPVPTGKKVEEEEVYLVNFEDFENDYSIPPIPPEDENDAKNDELELLKIRFEEYKEKMKRLQEKERTELEKLREEVLTKNKKKNQSANDRFRTYSIKYKRKGRGKVRYKCRIVEREKNVDDKEESSDYDDEESDDEEEESDDDDESDEEEEEIDEKRVGKKRKRGNEWTYYQPKRKKRRITVRRKRRITVRRKRRITVRRKK